MQEHIAATVSGRQQRAIAATFAAAVPGYPLLVEEATQVRVNQTAFHLLNRLAQGDIGQLFACLPPRKVLSLEDALHLDLQTIPVTGTLFQAPARCTGGDGHRADSRDGDTTIGADRADRWPLLIGDKAGRAFLRVLGYLAARVGAIGAMAPKTGMTKLSIWYL